MLFFFSRVSACHVILSTQRAAHLAAGGEGRGGEEEGEGEGPAEDLGDRRYMDISLERLFIPLSLFRRLAVKLTAERAD